MNIYLKNEIINDLKLSDAEISVYIALRSIYQSSKEKQYVSYNMIAYELHGSGDFKRAVFNQIKLAFNSLIEKGYVIVVEQLSTTEFILDMKKIYIDTNENDTYYTVIYDNEVHSILNLNTKADKLKILRYYVICLRSICRTQGIYQDYYIEKTNFVGFMTQEYLSSQTGIHINNILSYNKILMENHILYVHRHDEMMRNELGEFRSFPNHYGRYSDKDDIITFSYAYLKSQGINNNVVQSEKANHKRSVSAKYNNLCRDFDRYINIYSDDELIEIYKQIHHDNELIEKELSSVKEGSDYYDILAEKIRDEDIFDNIPCVVAYVNRRHSLSGSSKEVLDNGSGMTISGHDDQRGELDPLIDFSVDEILDMPDLSNDKKCHLIGEFQSDPTSKVTDCDLQSEGGKSGSFGIDTADNSVIVNSSITDRDDIELIDIDSLFEDEADDKPVLSQDEAWELFS
ncbi:MAG: hypothetical protein ACI32Z_04270 [Clostridium sp.]